MKISNFENKKLLYVGTEVVYTVVLDVFVPSDVTRSNPCKGLKFLMVEPAQSDFNISYTGICLTGFESLTQDGCLYFFLKKIKI